MFLKIVDPRNEFKEILNDSLEKEVIAFLTKNGGNIYIGVSNNGEVVGIKDNLDELQLKIKDRIKNNIKPSTLGLFDIDIENYDGKNIIHITVANGKEKPYFLRKEGMTPSGCFIRVGSSVESLTENQIMEYYSKRTKNSLTKIASPNQKLSFSELKIYYLEQGYEISDNFLQQLNLFTEDNKYNYIAYLLSDNNGISIIVATYSGTDSYDLVENEEFGYCSLIKATKFIIDKFNLVNRTFTKITGRERQEQEMFDKVAVREAIVNAIVHNRWEREVSPRFEIFSDHISITSSGGLSENLTKEEFLKGYSSPVNPELMRVFKDLNLVEQLGTGIRRILKYYSEDIYVFTPNFIKVDIPYNENKLSKKVEGVEYDLSSTELKILSLIKNDESITQEEMADKMNLNRVSITKNVKKLKEKGLVVREGSNKSGIWKLND